MKAAESVGTRQSIVGQKNTPVMASSLFGKISGSLNRLFGCWHSELSRPFSHEGQAYRVCLGCGARKQFNIRSWETHGDFYYGLPSSKHFRALN